MVFFNLYAHCRVLCFVCTQIEFSGGKQRLLLERHGFQVHDLRRLQCNLRVRRRIRAFESPWFCHRHGQCFGQDRGHRDTVRHGAVASQSHCFAVLVHGWGVHGGVDGVLGAGRSGQAHAVMRGDEFELEMYGEGMYVYLYMSEAYV